MWKAQGGMPEFICKGELVNVKIYWRPLAKDLPKTRRFFHAEFSATTYSQGYGFSNISLEKHENLHSDYRIFLGNTVAWSYMKTPFTFCNRIQQCSHTLPSPDLNVPIGFSPFLKSLEA